MGCKVCGKDDVDMIYDGIVRSGRFGCQTKDPVKMFQCRNCGVIWHDQIQQSKDEYYVNEQYREAMGEKAEDYYWIHDAEVLEKLQYTGTGIFRNKISADVGCGGGSFLDFISGSASEVIAIEPTKAYHQSLKDKGYTTYSYTSDAMEMFAGKVDVITSFDVIEHVDDPLQFLKEIYSLCKINGKVIIGTPSEQPVMRMALGEEYDKFLFSVQHPWIFNAKSLSMMAEEAGFQNIRLVYKQRYGLGNLISWLQFREPRRNVKYDYIPAETESAWIKSIEEMKLADYMLVYAEK